MPPGSPNLRITAFSCAWAPPGSDDRAFYAMHANNSDLWDSIVSTIQFLRVMIKVTGHKIIALTKFYSLGDNKGMPCHKKVYEKSRNFFSVKRGLKYNESAQKPSLHFFNKW